MPVERYGVWKGVPVHYEVEARLEDTASPHFSLYFVDNPAVAPKFDPNYRHKHKNAPRTREHPPKEIPGLFRAELNIKSGSEPESRLVYWVNHNVADHPIVERLKNLDYGFHSLADPVTGQEGLDYIRSDLFRATSGRILPQETPHPNNHIIDILEPRVKHTIERKAEIYMFGSCFNTQTGMHNMHMNQGNIRDFRHDDGVFQDGGLLIHHTDSGQWTGVFLGFASQAVHTDDEDGHAISPLTWGDLLATDLIENSVAIKEAYVAAPAPAVPGEHLGRMQKSVTLANLTNHRVSLASWKLHNSAGHVQELPRNAALHSMGTGGFEVPNFPLSTDGDTITLMNEHGLKVDGVSYGSQRGKIAGQPIVFAH